MGVGEAWRGTLLSPTQMPIHDSRHYRQKNGTARQSLARDALAELKEGDEEAERANIDAFGVIFGGEYYIRRSLPHFADVICVQLPLIPYAGVMLFHCELKTAYWSLQTVAALSAFTLAMLIHPEVQAKAHAEIDAAIGHDRLPEFEDRPSLPYVEALLMEVLRWMPVTPQGSCRRCIRCSKGADESSDYSSGVPHAADEDVIWKDYCIPKGAIVIGNAWYVSSRGLVPGV
jgi:hypothetical protein